MIRKRRVLGITAATAALLGAALAGGIQGVTAPPGIAHSHEGGRLARLVNEIEPCSPDECVYPDTPEDIMTLYATPTSSQWTTLEDSQADLDGNIGVPSAGAIIDACDYTDTASIGPGCDNEDWTSEPTGWSTTVPELEADDITPLIYLTSDYGQDSLSTLENEMAQAKSWWGITDVMVDEMTGPEGYDDSGSCYGGMSCITYYGDLYSYALSEGATVVMFNPGSWYDIPPAYMFGPEEILQGFENSEQTLLNNTYPAPSWTHAFSQYNFSATISAGTAANLTTDIADAETDQDAGFVYIDNLPEPNPNYGTLPPFWSDEVQDLNYGPALTYASLGNQILAQEGSDYCLNETGAGAGSDLEIDPCASGISEMWQNPGAVSGSYDWLEQANNGLCITDPSDSETTGTQLTVESCAEPVTESQEWEPVILSNGYTEYENYNGLCMDNYDGNLTEGNKVDISTCNSGANQSWVGPENYGRNNI
jgi:hypothetical protein